MIEKKPFVNYTLDEDKSNKDGDIIFTTRLTKADQIWFEPSKKYLKQPKNSTAMKQLAEIGAIVVLHDPKMSLILDVILNNSRRNDRLGIAESEYDIKKI